MTVHPSCYRDQSKRDRTPYWGQVQRWVFKAKTREEWMETFNKLSPKDQYDVLARFVPVPKEVKVDNNNTFHLIIKGLENKVIDKELIGSKALSEHLEDDEDVDT